MSELPVVTTRLWRLAPWRHNELMRSTDRFESVVVLFAVVLALLMVPIAGAVGTATYDRLDLATQAAQARHPVVAVLVENAGPSEKPTRGVPKHFRAPARWWVNGVEHTGDVDTGPRATAGQTVAVWIGPDGQQASPPRSGAANAAEAAATALVVWVAVTSGCAAVLLAFDWLATKRRLARWDRKWERVGQSPGWTVA
ncbi:MAG TPA: hypothetical protein VIW24_25780 [Aldersonia sp.]